MKSKKLSFGLATSIIFCAISSISHGAALSWDTDPGTAGNQGGAGTWDLANTNWINAGTNVAWTQTNATTALHTATFGGGVDGAANAYDITLGTNLAAQTLTFSNTGYRLTATGATNLALNNVGTGVIAIASGKSATIGNNVVLNFNSTSNTGQRVSLTGGSTLDIAAGGTLTKTGVVTGPSATGSTLGFTGGVGIINVAGTLSYNLTTPGNYGGIVISNGATSDNITLNVNGGTVSSNSLNNGVAVVSGNSGVRAGTLTVNSGLVSTTAISAATSGINIANGTDSTGTVNLNGGTISTFQINSNYLNTTTNTLSTGGTSNFNFHGGTLRAIANNTAFMGGLTNAFVKSGGAVIDTNGFNVTIAQQLKTDTVSTGGGLTKNGGGALTLTGANTYTGPNQINAGTVIISGTGTLGTGPTTVASGAILELGNVQTYAAAFSGAGNINHIGGGQATFTGDWSAFTGTYTHNSSTFSSVFNTGNSTSAGASYAIAAPQGSAQGMIAAGSGDYTLQLGSLTGVANSLFRGGNFATGTTTLEVGALGTSTTFPGIIANGATKIIAFTKVGGGTLTLSGASTYTGATLVAAGTLNLSGSLGTTNVTVASGATLAGEGGIGGNLTFEAGSTLLANPSTPGALSVTGDLNLTGVTQVNFGPTIAVPQGGGSFPFINYTGTLNGTSANLSIVGLANYRNPQLNTATAGQIALTVDSQNLIWSGASADWDINATSNWNSGTDKFFDGDAVTFNDTGITKTVNLATNVVPADVVFENSTGNNYSLGGSGSITGATNLTKLGSGTLTLNSAQSHTGTTFVDAGTLTFGITNALPGGTIQVSGSSAILNLGTDQSAAFGLLTLDNGGTLAGTGSSTISSSSNFILRDGTVALPLSGTSGATKSGIGTVTLVSASTYTGITSIDDGNLVFEIANALSGPVTVNGVASVLDLGANHNVSLPAIVLAAGSISGSGTTSLSSTGPFDFRSGTVGVPLTGTSALNKTTADTVTMTAANSTYSGGTNIGLNGTGTRIGVIRAAAPQSLGTGTILIGIGGNDATARLELENNISLDNPITMAARNNTSVAIQNVSGNNTLSGTLGITAGGVSNTIQSDSGTLTFSGISAITNETAVARIVTFQGEGNITISGAINNGGLGGSLAVVKSGIGTLTFSGINTYSGNTTVTEGQLVITQDDVLNDASTLTLASVSSLNLTHSGTDRVGSLVINEVPQPDGLYTFGTGKIQVGEGGTPFQAWAAAKGLDGTAGKENGLADDPDNDGASNLEEFAFNGNPLSGSDNGIVRVFTADTSNPGTQKELVLTIAVRAGAPAFSGSPSPASSIDGITYSVEGSVNLSAFTTAVSMVTPITAGLPDLTGSGYEYRSFSLDGSAGLPGKGFLRAKATAP